MHRVNIMHKSHASEISTVGIEGLRKVATIMAQIWLIYRTDEEHRGRVNNMGRHVTVTSMSPVEYITCS